LSPVGLSLVTKLAPMKIVGFLMGIWFLSSSIAHQGGKHIAKMMAVDEGAIVQGEKFQGCLANQEIKTALKEDFFQNWLSANPEGGEGTDPCAGLTGAELELCRGKNTLDEGLANPQFATYLNGKVGSEKYYPGQIQIKEIKEKAEEIKNEKLRDKEMGKSYVSFLTTDPQYSIAGGAAPKVVEKASASQIVDGTSSAEVIQCLREDTLTLALSVFRKLGYIAIGCGIFLFLLGPMVSRWMHGIK
ncbi:MAG: hypothetical protein KDC24_08575, partial [Saprospiraceae bacterium]|nr:hypothetical protein [Saprospiraceae bacterium]